MKQTHFSTFSFLLAGLLPALAHAQAPALLSTVPARHSLGGSTAGPIQLTFSQAVTTPTPVRVNTNMRRGQRTGTFSGAGTSQVSFQPAQPFAPGESVAVTVPASVSSPAKVVEFRAATGRGAATFSGVYTIGSPLSPQPRGAVAGDVDQDGDLDLLVATASGGQVCYNNGRGQFTPQASTFPLPSQAEYLRLADFNGDGNLDLLSFANAAYGSGVSVNMGTSQGTFFATTQIATSGANAVTGDFNADGLCDIVVAEFSVPSLRLFPGRSSGSLTSTTSSAYTNSVRDLSAADMDEDGDLDLLINSSTSLTVYLNNGAGQFTAGASQSINFSYGSLTVGDFNGDGHADVACTSASASDVTLLLGTGTGGLQAPQAIPALSRTRHVSAGDLDGDGDLDLIVTNDRGITQTLLNNGNAQFSAASAILIGFEQFNFAEAADLNGDGSLDIYTGHSVSNPAMQHGLDIFFNQPPAITATAAARLPLEFAVAPNPAHERLTLTVPAGAGPARVELRDALGRLVRVLPAQQPTANGTLEISLVGLATGLYFVHAHTAAGSGVQRVAVQ